MTISVRIELVPAAAITAGIVNTPVPMMLPMTSAVADGRPRARAAASAPGAAGGGAVAATSGGLRVVAMIGSSKGPRTTSTVVIVHPLPGRPPRTGTKVPRGPVARPFPHPAGRRKVGPMTTFPVDSGCMSCPLVRDAA